MLRRVATLAALGVLFSAPASAGVLLTYPTPSIDDAFYAAHSFVADAPIAGLDWIEGARLAPRSQPWLAGGAPIEPAWADYFLEPQHDPGGSVPPALGMAALTSHLSSPDAAPQIGIAPELNDF